MIGDSVFSGDIGLQLQITFSDQDLSTASGLAIKYKNPNGTTGSWSATLVGTDTLQYTTSSGDLSVAGTWTLQGYAELPTWSGYSDKDFIHVKENI